MLSRLRHTVLCSIIFLAVGELLVRFDATFEPLHRQHEVMVATQMAITDELELLESNQIPTNQPNLRVMVLGDSFVYGAGVAFDQKVSRRLKEHLSAKSSGKDVFVLDLSRPSNNIVDNHAAMTKYFDQFKPQVVVLGYHMNDLVRRSDSIAPKPALEQAPSEASQTAAASVSRAGLSPKSFVKNVYRNSKLAWFVSRRSQNYLRTQGVELPFGEFHYFTKVGYQPDNPQWKATQDILEQMQQLCSSNECQLIVYKMPSFHLLPHQHFFQQLDTEIARVLGENDIEFINGKDDFDESRFEDYILSKYDGHPNALAHDHIAQSLTSKILNQASIEKRSL